jgi:hypothetical protein
MAVRVVVGLAMTRHRIESGIRSREAGVAGRGTVGR